MDDSTHATPIEDLLQHQAWVHAVARRLVYADQDVDDVAQHAWLAALEKPPHATTSARGWLATIMRRGAARIARAESRRRTRERRSARPEAGPSTADVVARAEVHERVVRAVMRLTEPYRATILLRFYEGLSPQEIASRLGAPVETVRSRIRRGLGMLREDFESEHRERWRAMLLPLAGAAIEGKSAAAVTGGTFVLTKIKIMTSIGILLVLSGSVVAWSKLRERPGRITDATAGVRSEVAEAQPAKLPARYEAPEAAPDDPQIDGHRFSVVDAAGKPVAGASILVVREGQGARRLDTDARGAAMFEGVRNGVATVWVTAAGHASAMRREVDLSSADTRVALSPVRDLRVKFVTSSGDPIPPGEAKQRFAGRDTIAMLVAEEDLGAATISKHLAILTQDRNHWCLATALDWDDAGARSAVPPPAGEWRLFLTRPGATPFLSSPFGKEDRLEVAVLLAETPQSRKVRFVEATTRAALAGATVTPWYEHGDDRAFLPGVPLQTDRAGEVSLPLHDAPRDGRHRAPTWWVETPTHLGALQEWRFAEKEETEIEVPRRAAVYGKAWLPNGALAFGHPVISMVKGRVTKADVGADGSYRIDSVLWEGEPIAHLLLIWDMTRAQADMVKVTLDPGGATRFDIGRPVDQEKGAGVSGRITSSGRGLEGVFVLVQSTKDGSKRHVATSADGRYAIEGLEPVPYDLRIYLGEPAAIDDFAIRSREPIAVGAESRPLDFDLPAGAIAVTVVDDETGKPIPRAVAFAAPSNGFSPADRFAGFVWDAGWGGFCNDQGIATLRALPEGTPHDVSAGAEGYPEASEKNVLPATLASPTRVTVRLRKK